MSFVALKSTQKGAHVEILVNVAQILCITEVKGTGNSKIWFDRPILLMQDDSDIASQSVEVAHSITELSARLCSGHVPEPLKFI